MANQKLDIKFNGRVAAGLLQERKFIFPGGFHLTSGSSYTHVLLDFSLTVKAATLIFISGCGSAISSAKEGKSGFIYDLVKS